MHDLGTDVSDQAILRVLTEDVVKTSGIEGEKLNPERRSSIARRLTHCARGGRFSAGACGAIDTTRQSVGADTARTQRLLQPP